MGVLTTYLELKVRRLEVWLGTYLVIEFRSLLNFKEPIYPFIFGNLITKEMLKCLWYIPFKLVSLQCAESYILSSPREAKAPAGSSWSSLQCGDLSDGSALFIVLLVSYLLDKLLNDKFTSCFSRLVACMTHFYNKLSHGAWRYDKGNICWLNSGPCWISRNQYILFYLEIL